jgi:hypothetical protein
MPKQTPSIPNEVLWAKLGDRSVLSDELWLIAAQVGMLLGRSTDQLAEDRKVGNPPPFKKDGGSIRYRLGSVRDHMFSSPEFSTTTQSKRAANRNQINFLSNIQSWAANAAPDDRRPFVLYDDGGLDDFWEPLRIGRNLSREDRCVWLSRDDYLMRTGLADRMRQEFLEFLDHVASLRLEHITPARIAEEPFDKINAPVHLHWIRQTLNSRREDGQSLGVMAMATLQETLQGKSGYWSLLEGIHRLLNESPMIYTATADMRQGEINSYLNAAKHAVFHLILPSRAGPNGEVEVRPKDLLSWAKDNNVPVDSQIEHAIKSGVLGGINPKSRPGRPVDPCLKLRGEAWRKLAYRMMKKNSEITICEVASQIAKVKKLGLDYPEETIRKQISKPLMIADGYEFDPLLGKYL